MATVRKQIPKAPTSQKQTKSPKKKGVRWGRLVFGAIATAIIAMICALGIYMLFIVNGNKILDANMNKLLDVSEAPVIYDVNNQEITTLRRMETRETVLAKDIPEKVKLAFIATEDRRFNNHFGIDFYSLGRAIVKDVVNRSAVEGGSTITQQLAKNVFTNSEKTVFRKGTEMSIAIAIENKFTKDKIMELYLNRIYFGNRAYGIKAAAQRYFGVSNLNDLKTWQIATLAAMPKGPNVYNPIQNPQKSRERRAVVLQLMAEQGYITEQERATAAAVEYPPQPAVNDQVYTVFMDTVIKEAEDNYKITEDELLSNHYKIYTTMDPKAQQIAEQTYAQDKFFQKDASDGKKIQSSMAIVSNKDGGIVALVGARGYKSKDLNLATDNPRQPGSSFKPIAVYGPALESNKYSPYSMLNDEKQSFAGYEPNNYDGVYRGRVSMSQAVAQSINLPAVWLLNEIGPTKGIEFANKLGIKLTSEDRNLAIALGGLSKGATPLQMATAYTAFANGGYWYTAHTIVKIIDEKGQEVEGTKPQKNTAMSAKTAYYMTTLLQGVINGGTGTAAKFDRPLAGKTGTTQLALKGLEKYNRDVWMVGYTPEWSAAVWEGFLVTDDKHYVTVGSGGPAVIFKEVMSKALVGHTPTQFQKPSGVPDPDQPPKAIGDLTANYDKEKSGVKLSWSSAGEKLQYQIYRKSSKDADFSSFMQSATTDALDLTVQRGEKYEYYVTVTNPDTNASSDKSNVVAVEVPQDAGALPPIDGQQGAAGSDKNPKGPADGNGKQGNGTGTGAGTGAGQGAGTGTSGGTGAGTGAGSNGGGTSGTGTGSGGTTGGTGKNPGTGSTGGASPGSSGTTNGGTSTGTANNGGTGTLVPGLNGNGANQSANPAAKTP